MPVLRFRGINAVNLDVKGRMAIPKRYRGQLDGTQKPLVVTIDTEEACLLLYPLDEWEHIEQKLEALPSYNQASRRIQRLLLGHAEEVKMDGNGRILLPSLLRDYAQLNKCVMLVGQGRKFEIWDEANWQKGRDAWLGNASSDDPELPPELKNLSL